MCDEFVGPISASLRLRATPLLWKKCRSSGEPLATLCPTWTVRDLNLRPPFPVPNALPLDQRADPEACIMFNLQQNTMYVKFIQKHFMWEWFELGLNSFRKEESPTPVGGPRLFRATISARTFSAPKFGAFWQTLTQTLALTLTLNNWTVKEHRIGAETICAENVRQRNRWRRYSRTEKTWSLRYWIKKSKKQS